MHHNLPFLCCYILHHFVTDINNTSLNTCLRLFLCLVYSLLEMKLQVLEMAMFLMLEKPKITLY